MGDGYRTGSAKIHEMERNKFDAQGAHVHRIFLIHSLRASSTRVWAGMVSIYLYIL